jgi:formate--tetrahydrofolate ligase
VIVATVRALKMNGGVAKADLGTENVEAVKKGVVNLLRHIENVHQFGVPAVVAINHFVTDTEAESQVIRTRSPAPGPRRSSAAHWANGGAGTEELANKVVEIAESGASQFAPLYRPTCRCARRSTPSPRASTAPTRRSPTASVRNQLHQWEKDGFGHLPICMAKTQYSFTTDPTVLGAPTHHTVPVREVRLAAGAGFIVAICGDIMTMPGLPKVPSAEHIHLDENGQIEGLF